MIRSRGYSTKRFKTLQSAYYNKPTPLQQASYDVNLINYLRSNNIEGLKIIMSSGISPNPCNNFGESLIHNICRRGAHEMLQIMLDCGSSLQVSDDYGRTPLHDACWAARPSFETVELVLSRDVHLFHMTDCRGAVPLTYVRKEHWGQWIQFLESKKEVYWPVRDDKVEEADPPLTLLEPNTRPLPDPEECLTPELAAMVASGKISPDEAQLLKRDASDDEYSEDEDSDLDSEYDSEEGSEISDSDSEASWDEEEMNDILNSLTVPGAKPVAW